MKYPIGIQDFEKIITGGYVYVDKTALIHQLVSEGNIYFLSRPRRFGKSLLVSTLKAYFKGKKELFNGLAIDGLVTEWAEYPVFHLDFNGVDFTQKGVLDNRINKWLSDYETIYGRNPNSLNQGDRFSDLLKAAHQQTGRRAVVLIDEYDKPLLDVLDTGFSTIVDGEKRLLEDHHRNILKGFYSVFKGADEHLQFVLLTGVTKFSQVSVFSGFNQPKDISMDGRYEALCGITEEELIAANPEIKNKKLKRGKFLYIPFAKETKVETPKAPAQPDESTLTDAQLFDKNKKASEKISTIKAAIVLPFNTDGTGTRDEQVRMVEYYEGFLMAVDSLKEKGVSIDLYTYDSGKTDASVNAILSKPEMKSMDIIFGPAHSAQIKTMSDFAEKNNIRLVVPFSSQNENVFTNPNIYQINT